MGRPFYYDIFLLLVRISLLVSIADQCKNYILAIMKTQQFGNVTVTRMTPGELPDFPYEKMCTAILSKQYNASIIFTDTATATRLNTEYKKHDGPANILSFPYSGTEGEIYLSLAVARKNAKLFGSTAYDHTLFLLVHGMLHLAGHVHGSTMESLEKKFVAKFSK